MSDGVGLRSERGPVLVSLLLSLTLVTVDTTVISTAVPSMVRDIGGYANYPW